MKHFTDKERTLCRQLLEAVSKLSLMDKMYVLGVAEGMSMKGGE